jgi:hypothetical protein
VTLGRYKLLLRQCNHIGLQLPEKRRCLRRICPQSVDKLLNPLGIVRFLVIHNYRDRIAFDHAETLGCHLIIKAFARFLNLLLVSLNNVVQALEVAPENPGVMQFATIFPQERLSELCPYRIGAFGQVIALCWLKDDNMPNLQPPLAILQSSLAIAASSGLDDAVQRADSSPHAGKINVNTCFDELC